MLLVLPAAAQEIPTLTIREIKEIPQENITTLMQRGADLSSDEVYSLTESEWVNKTVRFTGIVLTDVYDSGLASFTNGRVGRVHYFVRDTTAVHEGVEGMDIQIVDGAWDEAGGSGDLVVGDVITVTGTLTYFSGTIQINPEGAIEYEGNIDDFGWPEDIIDPMPVTTSDLMTNLGPQSVQINWENLNHYNNQFVRLEGATVWRSPNRADDRPNYAITSDGAETVILSDDVSIRYRNDRAVYPDRFNKRAADDPFIAPPAGATVNIQGFVFIRGTFAGPGMDVATPPSAILRIAPMTDDDLVVTAEPLVTNFDFMPFDRVYGEEEIDVRIGFDGDESDINSVIVTYESTAGGGAQQVTLSVETDSTFSGAIPVQPDEAFVTMTAQLVDRTGNDFDAPSKPTLRVLYEGITEIRHLRETPTGTRARSPFYGMSLETDIVARVQTDPGASGLITLQDDEGLGLWSGVWVRSTEALTSALNLGDEIRVTEAEVEDEFGVVYIRILDYDLLSDETEPYPHKVLTTNLLQDQETTEPHVGMLVRFNDVTIVNPDASFGEWTFSTKADGTDWVKADDLSNAIAETFASTTFEEGDEVSFLQGAMHFSFSEYKLIPIVLSDVGEILGTDAEDGLVARFSLDQNYPNPFNPSTQIDYSIAQSGAVTLDVFDMLGRKVATLVDEQQAAGSYSVAFDGTGLASGLYLYRLSAGDNVSTRTMVLIK